MILESYSSSVINIDNNDNNQHNNYKNNIHNNNNNISGNNISGNKKGTATNTNYFFMIKKVRASTLNISARMKKKSFELKPHKTSKVPSVVNFQEKTSMPCLIIQSFP